MQDDLAQVAITIDSDDDLIWAEEKPGLTPGEKGQLLRHRADHTRSQQKLRDAIHGIRYALAAIQLAENPGSANRSLFRIADAGEDISPPPVLEAFQMLRRVPRIQEEAAGQRSTLLHYVSDPNWALEQQQVSWVEGEIAPLHDWVAYRARRAIWPNLAFCPQMHSDIVRLLPPQKRHHITWNALDAANTARVERLLDDIERESKMLMGSWLNIAMGVRAWSTDTALSDELVREAARFIEIEGLSQDLDPYCARRGDPRGLPGRGNVPEHTPMILGEPAYPALLSRCSESFLPAVAFHATEGEWRSYSTIQRAYAVNAMVVRVRVSQPDCIVRMSDDDLVAAANGDAAAWERLRVACIQTNDSHPAPDPIYVAPESKIQSPTSDVTISIDGDTDAISVGSTASLHFKIRGLDRDESDEILREVLRLSNQEDLDSRTIGVRLGPRLGDSDVSSVPSSV